MLHPIMHLWQVAKHIIKAKFMLSIMKSHNNGYFWASDHAPALVYVVGKFGNAWQNLSIPNDV